MQHPSTYGSQYINPGKDPMVCPGTEEKDPQSQRRWIHGQADRSSKEAPPFGSGKRVGISQDVAMDISYESFHFVDDSL